MIKDGYLAKKRDLFFLTETYLREETARAIVDFAQKQGRVWLFQDSAPKILHCSTTLLKMAEKQGLAVGDAKKVGTTGLVRLADWQEAGPLVVEGVDAIRDRRKDLLGDVVGLVRRNPCLATPAVDHRGVQIDESLPAFAILALQSAQEA
jgi:hypothetical protein